MADNRRYKSCDAPIGEYCKKHGVIHREEKNRPIKKSVLRIEKVEKIDTPEKYMKVLFGEKKKPPNISSSECQKLAIGFVIGNDKLHCRY